MGDLIREIVSVFVEFASGSIVIVKFKEFLMIFVNFYRFDLKFTLMLKFKEFLNFFDEFLSISLKLSYNSLKIL